MVTGIICASPGVEINTRNKVRRKMSFMAIGFNEVIAGSKLIQKKLNPNTTKNGIMIRQD
jgi:hypothetical protein